LPSPLAAVISGILAAPFHDAEAEVDQKDENEEHDAGGDEGLPVETGGIAHLDDDVGGHRAQAFEQPLGHPGLVARDHDHGHRFADGAADAQDDRRHHAGFGGRQDGEEHAALMGGAQGEAALVVAGGHGVQAGLAHRDDGGQDHDAQQHRGGEQAHALAALDAQHVLEKVALDHSLYGGHQHHHAEEAVDHRGDARQQLHGGQQHPVDAGGSELGHIDG